MEDKYTPNSNQEEKYFIEVVHAVIPVKIDGEMTYLAGRRNTEPFKDKIDFAGGKVKVSDEKKVKLSAENAKKKFI